MIYKNRIFDEENTVFLHVIHVFDLLCRDQLSN